LGGNLRERGREGERGRDEIERYTNSVLEFSNQLQVAYHTDLTDIIIMWYYNVLILYNVYRLYGITTDKKFGLHYNNLTYGVKKIKMCFR